MAAPFWTVAITGLLFATIALGLVLWDVAGDAPWEDGSQQTSQENACSDGSIGEPLGSTSNLVICNPSPFRLVPGAKERQCDTLRQQLADAQTDIAARKLTVDLGRANC